MDWLRDLAPALGRAGRAAGTHISTDLHDWDGSQDYHRPFLLAADCVFLSSVALGERAAAVRAELAGRTSLITNGAAGALLAEAAGRSTHIGAAPPPGPVIDTNGAGDAFVAGFVAGRRRGLEAAAAAGYAARVAAAACTHDGMEYPPGLLPTA